MSWTGRFRALTAEAVKQGANVIGQPIAAQGQLGKLLRKLADEPAAQPLPRRAVHVFEPTGKRAEPPPRWSEAGAWSRAAGVPPSTPDVATADAAPSPSVFTAADGAFAALAPALPLTVPERDVPAFAVGAVVAERYEIRRALGQGPAHRVYVARHIGWDIEVALKLVRADAAGLAAAPRDLAAEALRWTGLGLHPHVVYCHYVDLVEDLPLLVVEHRPGGTLRPWITSGRTANLRIGLNLAVQICHGLERAHGEGVWHGGLRPENMLFDADGTLAIADFGIAAAARLPRGDGEAPPARRRELEPYVAPEQWVDPAAIDARSDLFALGVCLYELFTGRRPFDVARGPRREPPDPGAHGTALPPRLAALLRRCIDWEASNRPLCVHAVRHELCAIHRELFRRASPFAELPEWSWDADGWNNQAVALHLLGHPEAADAAWAQALAVAPAHLEATYNAGLVGWSRGELSDAALRDAVARAAARRPGDPRAAALGAGLCLRSGDVETARAQLEAVGVEGLDDEGRALLETARRRGGASTGVVTVWSGHRGYVAGVQLLDGGQRAVTASDDGTLALWAAGQPAPLRVLEGHSGAVAALVVSGDGRHVVSGGDDATLRIWELRTGRCVKSLAVPGRIIDLAVSADLSRAVVACAGLENVVGVDNTALLAWNLDKERPLAQLAGHAGAPKCVAVSADGRLAASGSDDCTVRLWDLAQGGGCRRVLSGHDHYVSAVAISADGARIVSGGWDTTLRVWDAQGRCRRVLRGHEGLINAVALSADGCLVVSAGWDRTVRVWDIESGRCLRTFTGHESIVSAVSVSADGTIAASGSWDKTARLWRLPPPADPTVAPRLSCRGLYARLPSGEPDPDELLDLAEAALQEEHAGEALEAVRAARPQATGNDARRAATLWRALAAVCPRAGVQALTEQAAWSAAPRAAVHPAAREPWVIEALAGGLLRQWDPELERAQRTLDGHTARAFAVAIGERVVVSAAADTTVRVWDLGTGANVHVLDGHTSLVTALVLSADARWALSGSHDHTLRLWDVVRGRCEQVLSGHARQVTAVALDPAHARAVSGDYGGEVRVWDLEDGRCLTCCGAAAATPCTRKGAHAAAVTALRLSADGQLALSAGADGTLRCWQVESGACTAVLSDHSASILDADLSADGRWALSVDRDGVVRAWDLPAARLVATFPLGIALAHAGILLDAARLAVTEPNGRAHLYEIDWDLAAPPAISV